MRIGVNTRLLLDGKLEGIGWFTHEVFKRVTAMMPNVEFVFFFDRKPAQKFLYGDNVKGVILYPQARHPFLWYLWFEFAIPKALKQYDIDLFISPDGYLSLKTDVPTIITIHDLAFYHFKEHVPYLVNKYYNKYTPKFARKAQHIVTVSEFSKQDIIDRYQISEEKISVVGNGCNANIHPLPQAEQQFVRNQYTNKAQYFVFIGAMHPRKNVEGLLKAFDVFKANYESNIKLVLVGRMAWKTKEISNQYNSMKFKNDVVKVGHLEREELSKILGASLALVFPSFFEGFGIPLLEAMHAEIPIISSNRSSLPEVAGKAALYINPDKTEELVEALTTIAKDFPMRQALVLQGKEQRKKYSWDKSAAQMVEIIQEQIKKGNNN